METLLLITSIITLYTMVYYRLMVRHHYQKQYKIEESALGTVFSFPPYKRLNAEGRKYVKKYWMALGLLILCILTLVRIRGLGPSILENATKITGG